MRLSISVENEQSLSGVQSVLSAKRGIAMPVSQLDRQQEAMSVQVWTDVRLMLCVECKGGKKGNETMIAERSLKPRNSLYFVCIYQ